MGVLCGSRSSCPQLFGRAMDISSRQSAIILFILVAVSLLFRFDGMVESIWYDEVYRTKAIYFERSIWKILFVDCHNFLYNALMHILIHVFGDSEVLIRFPSLVMSYSSALIMQKWISDRWGRLFSVFVFAWFVFSPFHVWYSTEAKNNAMVMLFTVLIFVSYDALIARQDVKSSNAAIAASVLGIYTDFLLFFPIYPVKSGNFGVLYQHYAMTQRRYSNCFPGLFWQKSLKACFSLRQDIFPALKYSNLPVHHTLQAKQSNPVWT